jgi:large conductance mechanosensitive channel
MKIIKEFKEFAVKGNAVDMGVGIVIGAAFTSIVNSLVKDVITPLLGLITSGVDFGNWFFVLKEGKTGAPYANLAAAQADKALTLNLGLFLNAAISFLIVAWVLFFIIRTINSLKRPEVVTADPVRTRECPYCLSNIALEASRCPLCTSHLKEAGKP